METTFKPNADGIPTIPMAVGDELDFTFDWTAWLAGKEIVSYDLNVPQAILTKLKESRDGAFISVDLRALRPGFEAQVTCKVVTSGPRPLTASRTIIIKVVPRR